MKNFKTEGIIVRRKNSGEADRILTVFTKNLGKIRIKAKGIRKITSRRSAHVELLNHGVFTLYQGRNIPLLTEAQTLEDFSNIKEDLAQIGLAYHICELIDGLCPENQENRSIFFLLKDTLSRMREGDTHFLLDEFEKTLLIRLGFYSKAQFVPNFNTQNFIENILERRLKSKHIFSRI